MIASPSSKRTDAGVGRIEARSWVQQQIAALKVGPGLRKHDDGVEVRRRVVPVPRAAVRRCLVRNVPNVVAEAHALELRRVQADGRADALGERDQPSVRPWKALNEGLWVLR